MNQALITELANFAQTYSYSVPGYIAPENRAFVRNAIQENYEEKVKEIVDKHLPRWIKIEPGCELPKKDEDDFSVSVLVAFLEHPNDTEILYRTGYYDYDTHIDSEEIMGWTVQSDWFFEDAILLAWSYFEPYIP